MIYLITFILALCSIVYELLLGQLLSAFLGNTVLRYSVTIGLYLLAMGIGSILAEGRLTKRPLLTLQIIEILLTIFGGFSAVILYFFDWMTLPLWLFSSVAHGLIIIIGVLTGFEIPLLIEIRNREKSNSENSVLGIDYIGAFLGTVLFALVFYPYVGLVRTALVIGSLNALVGLVLVLLYSKEASSSLGARRALFALQTSVFVSVGMCLYYAPIITNFLSTLYITAWSSADAG